MPDDAEFELLHRIGNIRRQTRKSYKRIRHVFAGVKRIGFDTRVPLVASTCIGWIFVFVAEIRSFRQRSARFDSIVLFSIRFLVRFGGQGVVIIVDFGCYQFFVARGVFWIATAGLPSHFAHGRNAPFASHCPFQPELCIIPVDTGQEVAPVQARKTRIRLPESFEYTSQSPHMLACHRTDLLAPSFIAETIRRATGLD